MTTYRLYLESDLNRVFSASLEGIAAAELRLVAEQRLGSAPSELSVARDGRTAHLRFEHDADPAAMADLVADLSATAALFVEHTPDALEPIPLGDALIFGTELVTTQRYRGKTNERLTRLMVNVARAIDLSKDPHDRSLLDPMCGRGTTLNWALLAGLRSTGLDVDRRALDEYATFLQQWAQGHRYPHRMQRFRKGNTEHRHFEFTVARDRRGMDDKTKPDITVFHAPADDDSVAPGRHAMLVADLPYGVQHRATSSRGGQPVGELVASASARWPHWIRTGGSVVLAWNTKTLRPAELVDHLAASGFVTIETEGFTHDVDRTITRDVIAARRVAA